MAALYRTTISGLTSTPPSTVLGELTKGLTREGFEVNRATADSWLEELDRLQTAFKHLHRTIPSAGGWAVLLEYVLPMIGERVDCVLLSPKTVFVIEFKGGSSATAQAALRQAQGYALNLGDFQEASRGRRVVPLALGKFTTRISFDPSNPARGAAVDADGLGDIVSLVVAAESGDGSKPIDADVWNKARYFPVPTIIEAVSAIYQNNDVKEIAHSRAGVENLAATQDCIVAEVVRAKSEGRRLLLVVTGVPGAGKTLAGLNAVQAVQNALDPETEHASFLSGNGPLVAVLQEQLRRSGKRQGMAPRAVRARVRDVHRFVRDSYEDPRPPADILIVFDEAQRAWTAARNLKKFGRDISEPEKILEIMSRHPSWAAVIALVGGGQEIHGGEAGLASWGDALVKFPDWEVVTSPEAIHGGVSVAGSRLFRTSRPDGVRVAERPELHLSVSKRSIDSEDTAGWVNAALASRPAEAAAFAARGLPILLTRDIAALRAQLRRDIDSGRRAGLIASSGADRLRADGVETPSFTFLGGVDYRRWFLDPAGDFRSSNQLEVALSEFELQGLEIDCVGLLWGGDLVVEAGRLQPRRLSGTEWRACGGAGDPQHAADDPSIRVLNKYRVLLTRFRKSMLIFIPRGVSGDPAAKAEEFDSVYEYLRSCGLSDAG